MDRIDSINTIRSIRDAFSRFGIASKVVSDNGSQFTWGKFKTFCYDKGIAHVKSTPYHSRTNGLAERAIRTIKEKYFKLINILDKHERLALALYWYKNSKQESTQWSPSESMMGRRMRSHLDNIKPNIGSNIDKAATTMKMQRDKNLKYREFDVQSPVWVKNENKRRYRPGVITRRSADPSYEVMTNEEVSRKHADHLKRRYDGSVEVYDGAQPPDKDIIDDGIIGDQMENPEGHKTVELNLEEQCKKQETPRRSTRISSKPSISYKGFFKSVDTIEDQESYLRPDNWVLQGGC